MNEGTWVAIALAAIAALQSTYAVMAKRRGDQAQLDAMRPTVEADIEEKVSNLWAEYGKEMRDALDRCQAAQEGLRAKLDSLEGRLTRNGL